MTQMPSPFGQPPSPFGQPMGMFNQSPPPAQWTPFGMNVSGGGGIGQGLLQSLLPKLAQSMGGPQNFPAQFFPMQGAWDQVQAQRYWQGQQQAMAWATSLDVASMHQTAMGAHRMAFGQAPTLQEQQQYRGMAERAGQFLPAATMFLGPETVDMLMGPRGSATVMGQQLHRGLRTTRDPFTGAMGVQGPTAGLMAQEIYGQLFGPGANLAEMHGMTAGGAGALFEVLQRRGLAGPDLGARAPEDRLRALAGGGFQRAGTQQRVAEAYLRNQGRDVTPTTIEAAREQVFGQGGTLGEIRAGITGGNIDVQRMMEMPGAEELLSTGQAQTIGRRLKNISGAVSAMEDIFGSMGKKGTMEEIIAGLDALTQGGVASMTPGQLERVVRTTKNLAEVSGLGIQGMMGLQAQGANLADRLGLDRSLVVGATDRAAAWSIAARQTQGFDVGSFGGLSPEQRILITEQLEMTAMASQTAIMVGSTIALQERGLIQPGTDAERVAQAIRAHEPTWIDAAGQEQRTMMNNAEWLGIMRAGGVLPSTAEAVLADPRGSQQYIRDLGLGGFIKGRQAEVDITPQAARAFTHELGAQINQRGIGEVLSRQGMNEREINDLMRTVGGQTAQQLFQVDAKTAGNRERYDQVMGQIAADEIIARFQARPGTTAAGVQAVRDILDPRAVMGLGTAMMGEWGRNISRAPELAALGDPKGAWEIFNPVTNVRQKAEMAEAQVRGRMQAAMGSIGRHGPIRRAISAMQDAGGRTWDETLRDIMGFVPVQGAGGGMRTAVEGYRQAERYTQETVIQEEMDRIIAGRGDETLGDYRARIQQATGDERTRLIAERDRQRADLNVDPDFMRRMHQNRSVLRGRIGTLTERGMREAELWTTVLEGLNKGGPRAGEARLAIARELGGVDVEIGDMTTWWEAQEAAAGTPTERDRIKEYREVSDLLWRVKRGETITQPDKQGAPGEGTTEPADVGRLILGDPVSRQTPQVNRLPGATGGAGGGQDQRITARMSGTLAITGNRAEIAGDMELSGFEHNDVQTDSMEPVNPFYD